MNNRIGWGQPPPGWQAPGWAPLVDPDPRPLRMARSVGRWWWPILALGGFLAVTSFVLGHDDPAPGLSLRGLCTIALAAAVVALLTLHRRYGPGPLARALAEYAVVFLLAVLVATTGVPLDEPAAPTTTTTQASTVPGQRPALVKTIDSFRDWLREWRAWARTQRNRGTRPEPKGAAMAAPPRIPTPPAPSIWRSHP